ncbi:MAG: methyl-accepting chemotaxis protein [Mariprofundus sp.]|nr:methyl-accepting chemotaxis protein [Mariprofundus sp.]
MIDKVKGSLSAKLLLSILLVFTVVMLLTTFTSNQMEEKRIYEQARQTALDQGAAAFDSLNMLMVAGSMEEREVLRGKLKAASNVKDVRFIRGDAVNAQYGEGLAVEQAKDALDRRLLAGEEVVEMNTVNGEHLMTVALPFHATEMNRGVNCLSCHDVASGTVNGGIRFTISLEPSLAKIDKAFWQSIVINLVLFAFGLLLIQQLLKRIVITPLLAAGEATSRIAAGDMNGDMRLHSSDEIGDLFISLNEMKTGLLTRMTAETDAALRIKTALDQVGTPVQIADADYRIFYMNSAAEAMFSKHLNDFRRLLPGFDPTTLMGSCIDQFHKNPAHQRQLLDQLAGNYTSADLVFTDDFIVRVSATPISDGAGKRIATIVEWLDRSAEVKLESEVRSVVSSAVAGDLTVRLAAKGKVGFYLELSDGINQMLTRMEGVLTDTIGGLSAIEAGNLTHQISGEYQGSYDTIKQAANHSTVKLAEVIGEVRDAADEVKSGSNEIAASNNTLSDRTQEQAAALEQTAAAIEEITGTVQQTADHARQANQLATDACKQAEKGGEVVAETVQAMASINQSSSKISDIIGVINEIAFQTNLLALNASVEAARAGEQGRGFAVVAGEVRSLAQRSAQAAKEIKELINTSVANVESGSELVNRSGESLQTIVDSVRKVGDVIAEIAAASTEQTQGIDQINRAIAQLDSGTQQNTAMVEESAAASKMLNDKASYLNELVSQFKLG